MKNEGTADRVLRLALGVIAILIAWLALGFAGALGIVVAVVGAVLIVTGLVGFCPAYRLVGIRTCSVQPGAA